MGSFVNIVVRYGCVASGAAMGQGIGPGIFDCRRPRFGSAHKISLLPGRMAPRAPRVPVPRLAVQFRVLPVADGLPASAQDFLDAALTGKESTRHCQYASPSHAANAFSPVRAGAAVDRLRAPGSGRGASNGTDPPHKPSREETEKHVETILSGAPRIEYGIGLTPAQKERIIQ